MSLYISSDEASHIKEIFKTKWNANYKSIAIYGPQMGVNAIKKIISCVDENWYKKIFFRVDKDPYYSNNLEEKVAKLEECENQVDVIIIIARSSHSIIYHRVRKEVASWRNKPDIIDPLGYDWNTEEYKKEFFDFIEGKRYIKQFEDYNDDPVILDDADPKLIAWYLPQYYQIPINDEFHGKGYTEWIASSMATPIYTHHNQPQVPYDLGYYNLTDVSAIQRQAAIARHYGIYGFCIHYYWFQGKKMMEKPLELLLEHPEIDIHYCLNWANETWTDRWSDTQGKIIFKQDIQHMDDEQFMYDILPYMRDPRYIRIDGKPVLSIYRSDIYDNKRFCTMLDNFRSIAAKEGVGDLYILISSYMEGDKTGTPIEPVSTWGGDARVEFPPNTPWTKVNKRPSCYIHPEYIGDFIDMSDFINNKRYMLEYPDGEVFRSAMLAYDNSPRRFNNYGAIYTGLNPNTYRSWLKDLIKDAYKKPLGRRYVFINSWNEWGESQHLEPDQFYGYAYLNRTKEAIEEEKEHQSTGKGYLKG